MSSRVDRAVKMFEDGFMCSQAVFASYSDICGLEENLALRIANGFGGGIARRQEICGAVSGAILFLSLKYGRTNLSDTISHEKTYEVINCFCERFIQRNNSINCFELLGCNLPEAKEKGLFGTLCKKCVRDSAEIIDELLIEANQS